MDIKNEWWQNFFSGFWLDLQPVFRASEQTRAEADFLAKALRLSPEANVLDVPCGEGRLSIELASLGYQVTGVDMTQTFLDDARKKASDRNLKVNWKLGDMRDLPWHEYFDGAFCFWGSFGYFDEEGDKEFLKSVFRTLKPGGRFLLDIHAVETILPRFREKDWMEVDDIVVLQNRKWNHKTGRVDEEWKFIRDGKTEIHHSSIRIYTYGELNRLMKEVGFQACEGYSSMEMTPFGLGAKRLLMVALK